MTLRLCSGLPGNFQKCSGEQCMFERGCCFKPKHWVCVTLLCYYGYSLFSAVTCVVFSALSGRYSKRPARNCRSSQCVMCVQSRKSQTLSNEKKMKIGFYFFFFFLPFLLFSLHVEWIQSEPKYNFKTFVRPKCYQRAQKSKVGRGDFERNEMHSVLKHHKLPLCRVTGCCTLVSRK